MTTPESTDGRPTWAAVIAVAETLTAADRSVLAYLGMLPWLSAPHLTVIAGLTADGVTRARLRSLADQGLVRSVRTRGMSQLNRQATRRWPDGRDDAAVWALTDAGLAALAWWHGTQPQAIAERHGLTAGRLTALLLTLPQVSASYDLLASLCRSRPGRPLLRAWEQPWPPRPIQTLPRQPGRLAQLTAVRLAWTNDGARVRETLRAWLLPDTGLVPVAALALALRRTGQREVAGTASPVIVATTDGERQTAWQARLADRALPSLVLTWTALAAGHLPIAPAWFGAADYDNSSHNWPAWQPNHHQRRVPEVIDAEPGTLAGVPAAPLARAGAALPRPAREALLLLAAHPFLPLEVWARLRGQTPARFRATVAAPLAAAELIRTLPVGERPANAIDTHPVARTSALVEVTAPGLALLAAQAGVSLPAAVRWAGWVGGGPTAPVGARSVLLATLAHTLGLDRLLVALHAPLAAHRFAPDDALLEWLPGTARRWRGVWPDAFVRIRHLGREYPAFVEYERGTHTPAQLVRKFLAYAHYAERDGPARDGLGTLPPVLVVTIGDADEARLAALVAALWPGGDTVVPVLLTTEARLLADGAGWLGRVWRTSQSTTRRYWPWEIEQAVRRR